METTSDRVLGYQLASELTSEQLSLISGGNTDLLGAGTAYVTGLPFSSIDGGVDVRGSW